MSKPKVNPDFSKPFVFFRKPATTDIHYWRSNSDAIRASVKMVIESGQDWWVIAPFLFFENHQLWAFSADDKMIFAAEELLDWQILAGTESMNEHLIGEDTIPSDFGGWVKSAADEIHAGKFSKTALSKVRRKPLTNGYNWIDWFASACERFPNALVFFVHVPGVYTWAGATPELFLSVNDSHVRSVSLAGTLHPDSSDAWTIKEREEQQFVTKYIRDAFVKSGFEDVAVSGPETINYGNLQHLKTTFQGTCNHERKDLLPTLIQHLHPTPAVGGLPKKEGLAFILAHENHDRIWYSGFVGNICANGNIDLFVNLRSMMVEKNNALLYAGAGITAQSKPDAEWLETEKKLMVNWELLK